MNAPAIQPKLVSLQADLAEMVEADEKEIEMLRKRLQKNRELLHAINGSLGAITAKITGTGNLTDMVRTIIKNLGHDRFTPQHIEHGLTTSFPTVGLDRGGIRTALWNLTKRNEIKCIRKGTNRVPAEYENSGQRRKPHTHPSQMALQNQTNGI